ncbi:hypothetical protein TrLO_g491 [Triparma laevis f. longispina]|uniref:Uncharacterized protein n=1 Tax=Triparma laevis f. longispina TaxID=1714387 RepID=A0A9W7CAC8_9STRA|nr:hypothetical protein TrLO_g491 [Triparma laevis f. longispina]
MNRTQLLAVVILALALLLAHSQGTSEEKMMRTEKKMQKTDVKLIPKREKRKDKLEKTDQKQKQNKKPSESVLKPAFNPEPELTPKKSRRQRPDKVDKSKSPSFEDLSKPKRSAPKLDKKTPNKFGEDKLVPSMDSEDPHNNPRKPCPDPQYARGSPDHRRWCTEDRKFYEIEEQVDDQTFLLVTETMKVNKQVILTCYDYQGDGTASTIRFQ